MILQEYLQSRPGSLSNNLQIVGTDISPTMLEVCRSGVYDALALSRGLSPERKKRFFQQEGNLWRVKDEIGEVERRRPLVLVERHAR